MKVVRLYFYFPSQLRNNRFAPGFLNVIISTLTSICQPIIFLRLLVHAFRHNAEKYALRRSNSSHSDDSEGSRKERLSVADADEIVSVYSVDSINSAGTATAVPPSILQPTVRKKNS